MLSFTAIWELIKARKQIVIAIIAGVIVLGFVIEEGRIHYYKYKINKMIVQETTARNEAVLNAFDNYNVLVGVIDNNRKQTKVISTKIENLKKGGKLHDKEFYDTYTDIAHRNNSL